MNDRYPDPAVEVLDPSFSKYRLALARGAHRHGHALERRSRVFRRQPLPPVGDIPNSRIMRWQEETGAVSVFRQPSTTPMATPRPSGPARHLRARCAPRHAHREYDGTITVIWGSSTANRSTRPTTSWSNQRPIWFTDPPFGILGNYEGHVATPELPTNVYPLRPQDGPRHVATGDAGRTGSPRPTDRSSRQARRPATARDQSV
jgi:gluconolactonase